MKLTPETPSHPNFQFLKKNNLFLASMEGSNHLQEPYYKRNNRLGIF